MAPTRVLDEFLRKRASGARLHPMSNCPYCAALRFVTPEFLGRSCEASYPYSRKPSTRAMGSALSGFFIDTEDLPGCIHRHTRNHHTGKIISELDCSFGNEGWSQGLIQTLSIMCAYGLILYNASNMLSNGSELLLLVPSISGIVGSVVLPVLGAVPDGAIMLFSGLGDAAQENITVGVGTLAGSTIMLLTIPWSLSILLGAVPVDGGVAVYSRRQEKVNPCALSSFGVSPDATIRSNAYVMVATALLYLVIQGPAFQYATKPEYLEPPKSAVASHTEHGFALAGLMLTTAAFVGYLVLMVRQSQQSSPVREYRVTAVALKALDDNPHISLSGIIAPIIADAAQFQVRLIAADDPPCMQATSHRHCARSRQTYLQGST